MLYTLDTIGGETYKYHGKVSSPLSAIGVTIRDPCTHHYVLALPDLICIYSDGVYPTMYPLLLTLLDIILLTLCLSLTSYCVHHCYGLGYHDCVQYTQCESVQGVDVVMRYVAARSIYLSETHSY